MTSQPFASKSYEALGGSRESSDVVAPLLFDLLGIPASVVDFGCGVGAWLAGFAAAGVQDFVGLEGGHPDPGQVQVPADRIHLIDLQEPVDLGRAFDVALSLEVGEHLPADCSGVYVESIARHTDAVLFSAAIPRQGGIDHINEQWPSYWFDLWQAQEFDCFDVVRWQVWDNRLVEAWYRQNLLLYARGARADQLRASGYTPSKPKSVVHPAMLEHYQTRLDLANQRRPRLLRGIAREAASSLRHRHDPRPAPPVIEWPL
jgi:hypothetical protein